MSKITVNIQGQAYQVDAKHFNPAQNIFWAGPSMVGSLVKQWIKQNAPGTKCWVQSETFANGNSLHVWLSTPTGRPVETEIHSRLKSFCQQFVYGSFNAMEDLYEYRKNIIDCSSTTIQRGVKYLTVDNRPKWDTVEYVMHRVNVEGENLESATRYISPSVRKKVSGLIF